MSNPTDELITDCDTRHAENAVDLLIIPRTKSLGGFSVRRVLPTRERQMVGPWTFFDHMGPAHFPAGEGINVRPHPHINLATVTYLFEGEILHRDSLGSEQPIRPGDINLMVAGKGIVHSERERPEITATDHTLHGLQLWLALPEAAEEMAPEFLHYPSETIPALTVEGVPVRVIMGSAYGVTSPVRVFADTLYIEAHLQPGQRLVLPVTEERAIYLAQGEVNVGGTMIPEFAMAVLAGGQTVEVTAERECRIAVIGGEPLGRRFMEWNFVSSRAERLKQAREDWKAGRFPTVPGDDKEFIPYPG
ncbi:pirin family protein [Marinobacter sp. C2H3]|uniref:pirin family protein n=1 Tax=Marinobacter sp. C2H3 TaxID=3119003 RepID=UPI00300EACB6